MSTYLKPYYSSPLQVVGEITAASPVALAFGEGVPDSQVAAEDDVRGPDDAVLQARLNNTELSWTVCWDIWTRGKVLSLSL